MSKIFCIGLSCTGKHSLMAAMEQLGYSTIHYPTDFEQVDQYDVSCDVFVWLNYKELDRRYPGSKFIYTNRDKQAWMIAMLRHLDAKPATTKSEFKREMRRQAWGSDDPDQHQLSMAYDKHLEDVTIYFKHRPQDILFMNIPNGDKWNVLCPFIKRDVPDQPFPHIDTSY